MTIQEIMAELDYISDVFPHRALAEAVRHRDEIIPELLRKLEDALTDIEDVASSEDYVGFIYAMYLLAQFRETRAYPILVKLVSADEDLVNQALGDVITDDLGRLLASVCGGDTSLICGMVENTSLGEYVRCGAMDALVVLLAEGAKTRDEAMGYFQSLFHGELERRPDLVWSCLVAHCCDIYPGEVMEEIEQAFADGLVDPTYVGMRYVKSRLAEGKDAALAELANDRKLRFVSDAARELSSWLFLQDIQQAAVETPPKGMPADKMKGRDRNAPCPCGSGRKFKKCCGV